MIGWLKPNPIKKLDRDYHDKLEQATQAQRKADIRLQSYCHQPRNSGLAIRDKSILDLSFFNCKCQLRISCHMPFNAAGLAAGAELT